MKLVLGHFADVSIILGPYVKIGVHSFNIVCSAYMDANKFEVKVCLVVLRLCCGSG